MTPYLQLSASAISEFKRCPYAFYMSYILGIRPIEDTDALRFGSHWHTCLEIIESQPGAVCFHCAKLATPDPDCVYCRGEQYIPENKDELLSLYLNEVYKECPPSKTQAEWLKERITILYSLTGYKWFYESQQYEVVGTEIPFEIPIRDPETGRILLNCGLVGKIDRVLRQPNGIYLIGEHKTTSQPVDSGSEIWEALRINTQKNVYIYAMQYLQKEELYFKDVPPISGCLYDFYHKPGIAPKKLTQGESKTFVETGEYFGQKFEVIQLAEPTQINIDGELADVEAGKKDGTIAIRETAEMFGARLLQDITERPEFYFASREVSCTDDEIKKFEYQIYNILKNIRSMEKYGWWYCNEAQCHATFKCPYTGFCYNGVTPNVNSLPSGFRISKGKSDDSKTITSETTA